MSPDGCCRWENCGPSKGEFTKITILLFFLLVKNITSIVYWTNHQMKVVSMLTRSQMIFQWKYKIVKLESIFAASNSTREKVLNILFPVARSHPNKLNVFDSSLSWKALDQVGPGISVRWKFEILGGLPRVKIFYFVFFGTTKRL